MHLMLTEFVEATTNLDEIVFYGLLAILAIGLVFWAKDLF